MALAPDALSTPTRVRDAQGWSVSAYPDSRLIPKINSMSKLFASLTGRKFGFQRFADDAPLFLRGNNTPDLWLPFKLIRSVSSLQIVNLTPTVYTYTFANAIAYPDGVFRRADWDAEGRLVRPYGWPRNYKQHADVTGHPDTNSLWAGWTISVAGDFGYILPQYDAVENDLYNPGALATDLPADLEEVLFLEIDETLNRKSGNLRREKTPGGRELEYDSPVTLDLHRRAQLMERLGSYVMPEALWAG